MGLRQETAVLKFDNVSYGYSEARPVVKNMSFGVYMDSRIALVGANGAASVGCLIMHVWLTVGCRYRQVDNHEVDVGRAQTRQRVSSGLEPSARREGD